MKIVEIIPQLGSGGGERFVVDLCNELVKSNEVHLLYFFRNAEANFYEGELNKKVDVKIIQKHSGIDLSLVFKLRRVIKKIRPDVVHTHLNALPYVYLALLGINNVKCFHTVHNDALKEAGTKIMLAIRKRAFKSRKVIAVTISKQSLISFENTYKMTAPLIYNGRNVDKSMHVSKDVMQEVDEYKLDSTTKILINIAHIDEVKHQDMLVRCVKRLSLEGYDIALILIGRVISLNTKDKIEQENCKNVHILGEKRNPLEYLKCSDVFCLCSLFEGLPISLLEAMGLGLPSVCTPVGGIVDLIKDGKNGFLSSGMSEECYYYALKRFLNMNNEELQHMRECVLNSYKPFTMTTCAMQYEKLFNIKNS